MKFDMTDNEVRADVVICVTLLIAGTALMSYNSLSNAPAPPVTVPVKAPVAHRAAKAGPAPIAKTPAKYVGQYNGSFHVGSSPISGRNGKAELKINAKGGAIGFAWLPPNELH
ncbi:MAG: hypothetical protein WCL39_11525, partial [Armatimonadota bacterium]